MRYFQSLATVLSLAVAMALFSTNHLQAQSCCSRSGDHSYTNSSHSDRYGIDGVNYCSEYSACSTHRDLSGASGDELARYKKEKAQDGETFSNWRAQDFTLPTTDDERLSLSDFRGQPVVLVFMSGHCSHCLDTHKILPDLQQKYERDDLVVLPVYVNSGSVADVRTWSKHLDVNYPILVSGSDDIARLYETAMVPSFFLIDVDGYITKKFVGFKSKKTLDKAFAQLVQSQEEASE